jgi:hypothetical protein
LKGAVPVNSITYGTFDEIFYPQRQKIRKWHNQIVDSSVAQRVKIVELCGQELRQRHAGTTRQATLPEGAWPTASSATMVGHERITFRSQATPRKAAPLGKQRA